MRPPFVLGFHLAGEVETVDLFQSNHLALQEYSPRPYDGKLTLFNSEEQPGKQRPARGWGRWASDVEIRTVPGDHFTMLREPHVRVLAGALDRCLRSVTGDEGIWKSPGGGASPLEPPRASGSRANGVPGR